MDFAKQPLSVRRAGPSLPMALCPAVAPRDGAELSCYRATLKTMLDDLFHVAIAFEPRPRRRPSPGWGAISVPTESQLRFDPEGWALLSIRLQLQPPAMNCDPDIEACRAAPEIPLHARIARTPDCQRLAVEWRLPEPCHPLLRPDRASGAVTSNPGCEFLTLVIPASLPAACASVAEPAPAAEPPIPGRDPHPDSGRPPAAERFFTITDTWVASRARFSLRQDRHLPTIRIVARWLAAFGFDIGQRVRVQAEQGRLILTPVAVAAEPGRIVRSLDHPAAPPPPSDPCGEAARP
jgi:Toxin SymE, type I toxin-antitoxin system